MKYIAFALIALTIINTKAETIIGLGDPEKMTLADKIAAYKSHQRQVSAANKRFPNLSRSGRAAKPVREQSVEEVNAWFTSYTNEALKVQAPRVVTMPRTRK